MDDRIISLLSKPVLTSQENDTVCKYVDEIRNSPNCWQICLNSLSNSFNNGNINAKFLCLQILEININGMWSTFDPYFRTNFRTHFLQTIYSLCVNGNLPPILLKKASICLKDIFVIDYPSIWSNLFDDLKTFYTSCGNSGVAFYLQFFEDINYEIAYNSVERDANQHKRNEILRDRLKPGVIPLFIQSLHFILKNKQDYSVQKVNSALCLIGYYSLWIDFNLLTADSLLIEVIRDVTIPDLSYCALGCVGDIAKKGMQINDRLRLMRFIIQGLHDCCVFPITLDKMQTIDAKSMGKFLNNCLLYTVRCVSLSMKKLGVEFRNECECFIFLLLKYVHEYMVIEPSSCYAQWTILISEGLNECLILFKQLNSSTSLQNLMNLYEAILSKFRVPDDHEYIFNYLGFVNEDENEDDVSVSRNFLKVILSKFFQINTITFYSILIQRLYTVILNYARFSMYDIESTLYMLSSITELMPRDTINDFDSKYNNISKECLFLILKNNLIGSLPHDIIKALIMKIVFRFCSLLLINNSNVLFASTKLFLDKDGLFNQNTELSLLGCYYLSKLFRMNLQGFNNEIYNNTALAVSKFVTVLGFTENDLKRKEDAVYVLTTVIVRNSNYTADAKAGMIIQHLWNPIVNQGIESLNGLYQCVSEFQQNFKNGNVCNLQKKIDESPFFSILLSCMKNITVTLHIIMSRDIVKILASNSILIEMNDFVRSVLVFSSQYECIFKELLVTYQAFVQCFGFFSPVIIKSFFSLFLELNTSQLNLYIPLSFSLLKDLKSYEYLHQNEILTPACTTIQNYFNIDPECLPECRLNPEIATLRKVIISLIGKLLSFNHGDILFHQGLDSLIYMFNYIVKALNENSIQDGITENLYVQYQFAIICKNPGNLSNFFQTLDPINYMKQTLLETCLRTLLSAKFSQAATTSTKQNIKIVCKILQELNLKEVAQMLISHPLLEFVPLNVRVEFRDSLLQTNKKELIKILIAFQLKISGESDKMWNTVISAVGSNSFL